MELPLDIEKSKIRRKQKPPNRTGNPCRPDGVSMSVSAFPEMPVLVRCTARSSEPEMPVLVRCTARSSEAVQLHDPGTAAAFAEARLCDLPERAAVYALSVFSVIALPVTLFSSAEKIGNT